MSTKEDEVDEVCASCGIKGGDDIKLKKCTACKLVWYCSVACQKEHRPQHKRECKRRAAEVRDELLFKQPEISHLGDCPICFLPLSLDRRSGFHACCGKLICRGCHHANDLRQEEESLEHKCPFCRTPIPETEAEANRDFMKRVGANDPFALCHVGTQHYDEQNYSSAFKLYTKAAELGDAEAHYELANLYTEGQAAERDMKKVIHHLEEAAIRGHPRARLNLGADERHLGRIERAVKHYTIGANLGHDECMEELKKLYRDGFVKKEDLAAALRAHKDAVDATRSPQRAAAEQKQMNEF